MSYLSRLFNHRNAKPEEGKDKPFFSKKQQGNDANKKNSFFQTKLAVNEPGDKYEREADSVANRVVANKKTNGDHPSIQRLSTEEESKMPSTNDGRMAEDKRIQEKPIIQKMDAPEKEKDKPVVQKMDGPEKEKDKPEVQKMELPDKKKDEGMPPIQKMGEPEKEKDKPIVQKAQANGKEEDKPLVRKMELPDKKKEEGMPSPVQKMDADPEKDKIHKKEDGLKEKEKKTDSAVQTKQEGSANTASAKVDAGLKSNAGRGRSLPIKTVHEMNNSFGVDFSGVSVHDDAEAAQLNETLNAQAFTHGNDIYFNSGKFNADSTEGKHLLAHELTHVVQQNKHQTLQKKDDKKGEFEKKYSILIQEGDKKWSPADMELLFAALKSLTKDEATVLRKYRFVRWSSKAERAKKDKDYVDPGVNECGQHEADIKNGMYRISMYDACFSDPEAVSQKTAGIDSGQFTILHEIGHAMQSAELRNKTEAYKEGNAKYNKSVEDYNKASGSDQKKMKPSIDKLDSSDKAAEEAMVKSKDRSLKDLEKLIEGKTPMTEYAETNSQEAFAEAFAIYKANPDGFKKLNPKLFEWFSKGGFLKAPAKTK